MSTSTGTEPNRQSFAEAALRLSGKSEEEARRMGAVDTVRTCGTAEQKRRFLPRLASGEALSGFALTEPWAGSDLTALRTTAVRVGDDFEVTGEKLFITNAIPGRTIGLVVMLEGKPAVLIAELPPEENEHFRIVPYGLYALRHAY